MWVFADGLEGRARRVEEGGGRGGRESVWPQSTAADPGCRRALPLRPSSGPQPPRAPAFRAPGPPTASPARLWGLPLRGTLRDLSSVFQATALLYALSHFQSSPTSPALFSLPRDVCHLMPLKKLLCFEQNFRCTEKLTSLPCFPESLDPCPNQGGRWAELGGA